MILDSGICTVFRESDVSGAATSTAQVILNSGRMTIKAYTPIWASWYGELSFETTPAWQTDGRKELRTDKRIRVMQCSTIRQNDIVVLEHLESFGQRSSDAVIYRITRAWHGKDDDGPAQISDLTLEVVKP